jgi:hypothetical protein
MVNSVECKKINGLAESARREIAILARQKKCRTSLWTRDIPTQWQPHTVRDLNGEFFTDPGAWEFVANLIEDGHTVEEISLRHPPGKRGLVMKVRLDRNETEIYIKIRLGSGKIIGYSFHYSVHS